MQKRCSRCKEDLPREAFGVRKDRGGILRSRCRKCDSIVTREWQIRTGYKASMDALSRLSDYRKAYRSTPKHKLIMRLYRLRREYNLSLDDFNKLVAAQDEKCRICSAPCSGGVLGEWKVDHDHVTGKVRGLLCSFCNVALGYLRDNPTLCRNAATYLEQPAI